MITYQTAFLLSPHVPLPEDSVTQRVGHLGSELGTRARSPLNYVVSCLLIFFFNLLDVNGDGILVFLFEPTSVLV